MVPQGQSWTKPRKLQESRILLKQDCQTWKGHKGEGISSLFLSRSVHTMVPTATDFSTHFCFSAQLCPPFLKVISKPHPLPVSHRSYSNANASTILHCPHSGPIISCNNLLTNTLASHLDFHQSVSMVPEKVLQYRCGSVTSLFGALRWVSGVLMKWLDSLAMTSFWP